MTSHKADRDPLRPSRHRSHRPLSGSEWRLRRSIRPKSQSQRARRIATLLIAILIPSSAFTVGAIAASADGRGFHPSNSSYRSSAWWAKPTASPRATASSGGWRAEQRTPSKPSAPTAVPSETPSAAPSAPPPVPTDAPSAAPDATTQSPSAADPGQLAGFRSVALQPFAVSSPWNVSLGSGAQYSSDSSSVTKNLTSRASGAYINAAAWSIPVIIASNSDPVLSVRINGVASATLHVPLSATPASGTDGHLVIIDGTTAHEYWQLARSSSGVLTASYAKDVDLTGQGTSGGVRASSFSALGGLIRTSELSEIDHALVIALAADQLKSGAVWPATTQDNDASSSYSGEIPMGTLVAIPKSVDLSSLGLSSSGLALARALQDYGAYVGDRSSGVTLYAEPSAEGSQLDAMRTDLKSKLASLLRVVTNSSSSAVGGPGTRLRAAAAEVGP